MLSYQLIGAFNYFKNSKDDKTKIRSMNTMSILPDGFESLRTLPKDLIKITHDDCSIISIKKNPIEKTNDIKFYKIKIEFYNGIKKELIVPSYVKFYSMLLGTFVTAEKVRARHILMDYGGAPIKAEDAELIENFKMTNYYGIKVSYEIPIDFMDGDKPKPGICNFYLDGVLANVSYNNFQMKEE